MMLSATCATIAALLAQASGGEQIRLRGDCPTIVISKTYDRPVSIDATGATVRGLRIDPKGGNVRWKGGTIRARDGMMGGGRNGYAVQVLGRDVRIADATITDARMGAVVTRATNVEFIGNRFKGLRSDGIHVKQSQGLIIANNRFTDSRPIATTCVLASGAVQRGVARRNCAGVWTDGDHADALQMRDGVTDADIYGNLVTGETQGLTQMAAASDAPLRNVRIHDNEIRTSKYHQITLADCIGCKIDGNRVYHWPGSEKRAQIREGKAVRCGNWVEDEPGRDAPCPS